MKTFGTTIYAKCPITGEMKTYAGPNVEAPSKNLAFQWCQNNGLGYCNIQDELIAEAGKDGVVDYEKTQNN